MNVWSICASISVTITDIWTKFGIEHKHHTTKRRNGQIYKKLKIKDGGGRHLEFRKNVNNFGLDKDILHHTIRDDVPRPCEDDRVTKKSKPEVNSRDVIKWMSETHVRASISVTITDIWTKFGTEHKYHTINTPEWPNSHKLKIQDGGGRHLEFQKKCQ